VPPGPRAGAQNTAWHWPDPHNVQRIYVRYRNHCLHHLPPAGRIARLPAEGLALFEAVQDALLVCELDTGQHKGLQVRGLACMSGCSRSCTVTLQAQGKFTYYFGDLALMPRPRPR
jgi:hypothetical protein